MSVHCTPGSVFTPVSFDLLSDDRSQSRPVRVDLSWSLADPFAVHAVFHVGHKGATRVEWVLARDTLAAGLLGPEGIGDVVVYPVLDRLRIVLDSDSGHAEFDVDPTVVGSFLAAIEQRCPDGTEFDGVDMDAALTSWLEAA